jgi:hypothetical protein
VGVTGTPDPGRDNGTTDCNVGNTLVVASTGSRSSCVSDFGAYDMVGNLWEWVADWVPRSTTCGTWSAGVSPTGDYQCLAGAATTGEPGALVRGGGFVPGTLASPLAVDGSVVPSHSLYRRLPVRALVAFLLGIWAFAVWAPRMGGRLCARPSAGRGRRAALAVGLDLVGGVEAAWRARSLSVTHGALWCAVEMCAVPSAGEWNSPATDTKSSEDDWLRPSEVSTR